MGIGDGAVHLPIIRIIAGRRLRWPGGRLLLGAANEQGEAHHGAYVAKTGSSTRAGHRVIVVEPDGGVNGYVQGRRGYFVAEDSLESAGADLARQVHQTQAQKRP